MFYYSGTSNVQRPRGRSRYPRSLIVRDNCTDLSKRPRSHACTASSDSRTPLFKAHEFFWTRTEAGRKRERKDRRRREPTRERSHALLVRPTRANIPTRIRDIAINAIGLSGIRSERAIAERVRIPPRRASRSITGDTRAVVLRPVAFHSKKPPEHRRQQRANATPLRLPGSVLLVGRLSQSIHRGIDFQLAIIPPCYYKTIFIGYAVCSQQPCCVICGTFCPMNFIL